MKINRLPLPEERSIFHDEMFKVHSHAEIENDINPDSIIYKEEDVLNLMRLVRDKTLEWAADNVEYIDDNFYNGIDKQSILKGKENKFLRI